MNFLTGLFTTTDATQFTGEEQTRIVNLLALLALTSIAMWAIVSLSIVARMFAKIYVQRTVKKPITDKETTTV